MNYLNKYFYKIIRDLYEGADFVYDIDEDRIIIWADGGDRLEYIYYTYYNEFDYVEDIIRKIEELI